MLPINVIKVGGAVVEDHAQLDAFLDRFAALEGLKVLVHGGGRAATALASKMGVETVMVEGRRVTDAAMLDIVTMVYGGLVNKNVVAALQSRGVNAFGVTGADLGCILSIRRPAGEVDYGFVGDVVSADVSILSQVLFRGAVPVVAPLTHDGHGQLLNTNADTVAATMAKAFSSLFEVTLTYCFEMPGVLRNPEDKDSVIPVIDEAAFAALKADGTVSGGMIPKLQNAFDALHSGVRKVVITSAANPGGGTTVTL